MNLMVQSYCFSAILLIWSTKLINNNTNRAEPGAMCENTGERRREEEREEMRGEKRREEERRGE